MKSCWYVSKRMEIAAAHNLTLDYESKCENLHGHNYICVVYCKSESLNANGMVVDFTHLKKWIHDRLDHSYLNNILQVNPTAENMAKWIFDTVNDGLRSVNESGKCYKVSVQESEGNVAVYEEVD